MAHPPRASQFVIGAALRPFLGRSFLRWFSVWAASFGGGLGGSGRRRRWRRARGASRWTCRRTKWFLRNLEKLGGASLVCKSTLHTRPACGGCSFPWLSLSFLLRVFAAFSYPKTVLKYFFPILNSSLTRFDSVRRPLLQPIFSASALKIKKWLHQNCANIQPGPVA